MKLPDDNGHFGEYGGRYISETLMPAVIELEKFYKKIRNDKEFIKDFKYYLKNYVGRPSPLYFAERLPRFTMPKYFLSAKI
jgi:tryptophan synthase, beta chain (EC 4.2.1.20)